MTAVDSRLEHSPSVSLVEPAHLAGGDVAQCQLCGSPIGAVGTPRVPESVFVDSGAVVHSHAPVYGYRCDNHRDSVVMPLPVAEVPGAAVLLQADVGGAVRRVGVPHPEVDR